MKKSSKRLLVAALLLAFSSAGTAGVVASAHKAELNSYTFTNVALGKSVKAYDYEMSKEIGYVDASGTEKDISAVTDGEYNPSVGLIETEENGWIVIDLGENVVTNKIQTSFWHNHSFSDVVIQIAKSADFSDAVTVYNADADGSVGVGVGSDANVQDVSEQLFTYEFNAVCGRYVRITNKDAMSHTGTETRVSEVQIFGTAEANAPVYSNLAQNKQTGATKLQLASLSESAEIYYTTDGSIPTKSSAKYEAPIDLTKLGELVVVRAIAVVDGVETLPESFQYEVSPEIINVAMNATMMASGKLVYWDGGINEANKLVADPSAEQLAKVHDGAEDPAYVVSSEFGTNSWVTLDFGDVYTVDTVKAKFWHNWSFGAIIQLSTTPDFQEGTTYTVFSNYGKSGWGAGKVDEVALTHDEWFTGMKTLTFAPVEARYLRAYSDQVNDGNLVFSAYEEISVFTGDGNSAFKTPMDDATLSSSGKLVYYAGGLGEADKLVAEPSAEQLAKVYDGAEDPSNVVSSEFGTNSWITLDFGDVYAVDTVKAKFWHNWLFGAVIQLSTTPDFQEGTIYTVFSNYGKSEGSVVNWGSDKIDAVPMTHDEWFTGMRTFTLDTPVEARYLRAYSDQLSNGSLVFSAYEELSATGTRVKKYPAIVESIVESDVENITVANGTAAADLGLSTTVNVKTLGGAEYALTGTWSCTNYDATVAGEYTFTFNHANTLLLDTYGVLTAKVTVAPAADKAALNAEITACEALTEATYVSTTWTSFAEKLAAAKAVAEKTVLFQSEVDEALAALTRAKDALVARGDKTQLKALMDGAAAYEAEDYTAASYAALTAKLAEVQNVYDDVDAIQSTVDGAKAQLQAAIDGLVAIADTTALEAKYDELKDKANVYTNASWLRFQDALTEAKAIIDKAEPGVKETEDALTALNAANEALVVKADYSALTALIGECDLIVLDNYITAGKAEFTKALAEAKTFAANDEHTAEEIAAQINALTAKKNALVAKGDKTALVAAIGTAPKAEAEYTASTYSVYFTAYENAVSVKDNADATQEAVDAALAELNAKTAALKARANVEVLAAKIAAAKAYKAEDYTAGSFQQLVDAIEYAESVVDSNDVEQATADEAVTLIDDAIAALQSESTGGCGCDSTIGLGAVMGGLILAGGAMLLKKRKDD